ncbi:hypothetical protein [Plantactinospora sp. B5E13]|uniref:hypothetical protein n=1 Tax=unclassified Plantactinospora TaxID=2631981 RepID=UPI00325EC6E8
MIFVGWPGSRLTERPESINRKTGTGWRTFEKGWSEPVFAHDPGDVGNLRSDHVCPRAPRPHQRVRESVSLARRLARVDHGRIGRKGRKMAPAPVVRLDGLSPRYGRMTWGQRNQYVAIEAAGEEAYRQNLVRSVPVPPGVDSGRISEALKGLLGRHEALRTYFGGSPAAHLWQRVAGSVKIPLLMFDVSDGKEVVAAKTHVAGHTFDHETRLPVRFGAICHRGRVRSVELAVSHLATDAAGADLLATELARSLAGDAPSPAPRRQPVDRAAWEGSPAGQAMSAHNVDRWRALMETGATLVPAARRAGLSPRFWKGALDSLVLREALPTLAARLRVSPSALLLAGMAKVVAEEFDLTSVPVRIAFNNRITAEDKVAVETLMGWGLCFLTGVGGSQAALAKEAATEAFRAYSTARYDIYDLLDVADRLRRKGMGETLPQFFLNVVDLPAPAAAPSFDPDRLRELQAAAVFESAASHSRDSSGLFIMHVTLDPRSVRLNFLVDTQLCSPTEVEQIFRRIEGWLVSLALRT